jgi:hypothetical protein
MQHISRKVITHFLTFHISDIGRLCNASEMWSARIHANTGNSTRERGWSLTGGLELQPRPCRRWQLTRRDPDEGVSVAKVHMDIDLPHLKKSNHSFFQFSHLGYRPTVYCVRDAIGPRSCGHWQLNSQEGFGGGLSVATHFDPTSTKGSSFAKVHMVIDLPHLWKYNHSRCFTFHISDIGRLCTASEMWSAHIHVNTGNSTLTGGLGGGLSVAAIVIIGVACHIPPTEVPQLPEYTRV